MKAIEAPGKLLNKLLDMELYDLYMTQDYMSHVVMKVTKHEDKFCNMTWNFTWRYSQFL